MPFYGQTSDLDTMSEPSIEFVHPPRLEIFLRGATGHCPRCECSEIFITGYRLHERCPQCDLPLEMEDGWSYGSVPLAYVLTAVGWGMPVVTLTLFGILSARMALIFGIGGAVVLPIITFKFTKKLWIGLYYAMLPQELRVRDPHERGDLH